MNFKEFWNKLSTELRHSREFSTLTRHKIFEAKMTHGDTVTVQPRSSKTSRDVPKEEFHEMWDIMKDDIRSKRYVNYNQRYFDFWDSSYINTLIDHVVKDQCME